MRASQGKLRAPGHGARLCAAAALGLGLGLWAAGAQAKAVEQLAEGTANWESRFAIDAFPTGKYNIYIEGEDKAGNVAVGGPFNVFIDPKSDLPQAHILNPLQGQRVGGDLSIVGTCSDDDGVARVEVSIDGGPWTEAQGKDLWILTVKTKDIPDGRRSIAVRGTDINGLVGPVVRVVFDLDHYKPQVSFASPSSGALVTGSLKLSGTASDANGLRSLELSTDGSKTWTRVELKRGKDPSLAAFQAPVDTKKLKDGPEILFFRAADGVGSSSTTAFLVMVANAKPLITLARPLSAAPVHGTVLVAGSVKDAVGLRRLSWSGPGLGSGELELRKGDPFFQKSFDARAIKGERFLLTLSAEDLAGNVSTLVVDRKIDRQADKPRLAVLFPAPGATLREGEEVYGSALDEDGVKALLWSIDGGRAQELPADGSFALSLPALASGKHLLSLRARDSFGVEGDPVLLPFLFDAGPGSLSFERILPAAAKAGSEGRDLVQGSLLTVDGGEYLTGRVTTPNPATRAEWRIAGGPARKLELQKGPGPKDWSWRIPVDASFPYGFAPLDIELGDDFGHSWGGKLLLYVTNYASAREDTGFFLDPERIADGLLLLSKDEDFQGLFWRDEIASIRLDPPTKLAAASFEGQVIKLSALAEGRAEGERLVVTTKAGHEFSAGPWTLVTDTSAPRLELEAPAPGPWIRAPVTVRGRASDEGGLAELSWLLLPAGERRPLKADATGSFSFSVDPSLLGSGLADLEVEAKDLSGNLARAYLALGADREGPAMDILAPPLDQPLLGPQSLVARLSDPSGIVSVDYAPDGASFAPVQAPGGWLLAGLDPARDSRPTWRLRDGAGNESLVQPPIKLAPAPAPRAGDSLALEPGPGEGRLELSGLGGQRKLSLLLPLLGDQGALETDGRFGPALLVAGPLSLKGPASSGSGAPLKSLALSLDEGANWTSLGSAKDEKSAGSALALNLSLDPAKQLGPGPRRLLLRAEDFAGGLSYSALDLFVDNEAPSLELLGPAAQTGPQPSSYPLLVHATDPSGLASLSWSTGQGAPVELGAAGPEGWYALMLPAPVGGKASGITGNLIARDGAGNTKSLPLKLGFDPSLGAPRLELRLPSAPYLAEGDLLAARATGPSGLLTLSLSLDGQELGSSALGALDLGLPALPAGKHRFLLRAQDSSGQSYESGRDFLALGPPPSFAALAAGEPGAGSPLLPGLDLSMGAKTLLSGQVLAPNGLASLRASIGGKSLGTVAAKAAQAGGPLSFSLPLPPQPYGSFVLSLSATDGAGLTTSRDFVLVSILPPKAGVDDGDGIRFNDARIVEGEKGRTVFLGPGESLLGRFKGRGIASFELSPPSPLLQPSFDGSLLGIKAAAEGSTGPTTLVLTAVDGDRFTWGPATFSIAAAGPTITIEEPSELAWTRAELRLRGRAADPVEDLASLEYSLNGGEWLALPRSGSPAPGSGAAPSPAAGPNATRARQSAAAQAASAAKNPRDWPFDLSLPLSLADGTVQLSLRARDRFGRESLATRVFTKDTEAPSLTQVLPDPEEAVNGLTTFVGEAREGGRLLSIDFLPAPGAEAQAVQGLLGFGGSLDLASLPSPLPEGAGFRARDAAGNESLFAPSLSIDAQADKPLVEIEAPSDNEVLRQDFAIAGVAFDDDGVKSISYRLDGGEWKDLPLEGMSFSLPMALADTTDNGHAIDIKATDIYGVVGDTASRSWRISTEEPFALLSSPPASEVVAGDISLSGSASDANGIGALALSLDNGTSWLEPLLKTEGPTAASWTYRLDTRTLADGPHALLLRPLDAYETRGLAAALLSSDNTPPEVALDRPLDGERAPGYLLVSGRVSDAQGLASARLEIAPIGSSSPPLLRLDLDVSRVQSRRVDISKLAPGPYTLRLIARDRAGNESLASRNFLAVPPDSGESVELLYPEPGAGLSGPFSLSGVLHANGPVEAVDILLDGTVVGQAKPGPGGEFSYAFAEGLPAEGRHQLSASALVGGERTISGEGRSLDWRAHGPWLTIDSLATDSFLPYRPFLRGKAGFSALAPDPADKAAYAAFQKTAKDREVKTVELSLDGGRSWEVASGREKWSFRIETQNFPEGPFFAIVRATYGDGTVIAIPTRFRLDKSPPELAVLAPLESSRQNQSIEVLGTASDENGIASVKVLLRKGDKANYELPSFIQGLYVDAHVLGATTWEAGAGLTFFGDNVKLQGLYGEAPTTEPDGSVTSFGGAVFGAKLIANLVYLPLSSFFGPDWEWLSLSLGLGTDFSYFSIVNGDPSRGLMLSSVFAQVEFPKVTLKSLSAFKKYSFYYEQQIWVLSSVVKGGFIFKPSFGLRLGIF